MAGRLAEGEAAGEPLSVGAPADGSDVGATLSLAAGAPDGVGSTGTWVPEGTPEVIGGLAVWALGAPLAAPGVDPVPLDGVLEPQAAATSATRRRAAGARLMASSVPGRGTPRSRLGEPDIRGPQLPPASRTSAGATPNTSRILSSVSTSAGVPSPTRRP